MIRSFYVQIARPLPRGDMLYLKRVGFYAEREGWAFFADPMKGGFWHRQDAEEFLERRAAPISFDGLSIVDSPSCPCCTKPPVWSGDIQLISARIYRCAKHTGRVPCCIEGCGKTFALKEGESYENIIMCGRHWRQAPKRFRDLEALIRRRAKKRGWTDKLYRQHHWIWHRAKRAIEKGCELDMTEINKMFGW